MSTSLRAQKVGSIAGLKRDIKKGAGGAGYLARIPANGERNIRFITEPTEWISYYEHYNSVDKFFPCGADCKGCMENNRPSSRYLASALDIDEDKVIPLVLPQSAVAQLLKFYEKYSTIMDRDYDVSREGEGKENTEYFVLPGDRTPRKLSKYDELNLIELLEAQIHDDTDDDDVDDDDDNLADVDVPAKKVRATRKPKPKPVEADEEDDDDDDVVEDEVDDVDDDADAEDDDAEDDSEYTRADLEDMSRADLRKIALDADYTTADLRGLDSDALVDLLLGEADEDDEADDTEDADDDDDVIELDEDTLAEMSLAELKTLAKEVGVKVARGVDKEHLIELILAEEDEDAPF